MGVSEIMQDFSIGFLFFAPRVIKPEGMLFGLVNYASPQSSLIFFIYAFFPAADIKGIPSTRNKKKVNKNNNTIQIIRLYITIAQIFFKFFVTPIILYHFSHTHNVKYFQELDDLSFHLHHKVTIEIIY